MEVYASIKAIQIYIFNVVVKACSTNIIGHMTQQNSHTTTMMHITYFSVTFFRSQSYDSDTNPNLVYSDLMFSFVYCSIYKVPTKLQPCLISSIQSFHQPSVQICCPQVESCRNFTAIPGKMINPYSRVISFLYRHFQFQMCRYCKEAIEVLKLQSAALQI